MGMCAIRGSVVTTGEEMDSFGDATPRSATSSGSYYVSSCSQELEAGEVEGGGGFEPAAALWQRTIPKGRRCRPLSFSGLIVYDASGHQLDYCPRMPRDGRADRADPID